MGNGGPGIRWHSKMLWMHIIEIEHSKPHFCSPKVDLQAIPALRLWDYLCPGKAVSCALCWNLVSEISSPSRLASSVTMKKQALTVTLLNGVSALDCSQEAMVSVHSTVSILFLPDSVARLSPPTQEVLGWHKSSG